MKRKPSIGSMISCSVLMLAIFFADLSVPLGIATGAFYVAVIVLGSSSNATRLTYIYAAICSVLLLAGIYFYPIKLVSWTVVLLNRAIFIALIWSTAVLIVRNQRTILLLAERDAQLEETNTQLRRYATEDYLTGLPNRRAFSERLGSEFRRAIRERSELSLLMIDVDLFKSYNDEVGHQAGDDCLARIAKSIKATLHRPADMGARYGGEEFAVILPATEMSGALEIAQAIRQHVAALRLRHPALEEHASVTVSVGVATLRSPPQLPDVEALVEAADRALYQAKESGRNKVCSSSSAA